MTQGEWTVVVPMRAPALDGFAPELPDHQREALLRAFGADVLEAVAQSSLVGRVVLVGTRHGLDRDARRLGVAQLGDLPLRSSEGLNDAVALARRWAAVRHSDSPIVVVPADLPCLTTEGFDKALGVLSRHDRAFVPDAAGRGTTLLSSLGTAGLRPHFGRRSAGRHRADGVQLASGIARSVRHDVDTVQDLSEARRLGVGLRTRRVLADVGYVDRGEMGSGDRQIPGSFRAAG